MLGFTPWHPPGVPEKFRFGKRVSQMAGDLHRDVVDTSRIPLKRPLQWGLNTIWPVDDFTNDNGATRFVRDPVGGQTWEFRLGWCDLIQVGIWGIQICKSVWHIGLLCYLSVFSPLGQLEVQIPAVICITCTYLQDHVAGSCVYHFTR